MRKSLGSLALLAPISAAAVFLVAPSASYAQTSAGALSGIVTDGISARIPGATLVLQNTRSRDQRKATSNSSGIFSFQAVPTATYTLTITRDCFKSC